MSRWMSYDTLLPNHLGKTKKFQDSKHFLESLRLKPIVDIELE